MNKSIKQGSALLVTSHITQRSSLRKTLSDIGIDNRLIEAAADYSQAKERLLKAPVNLLITDDFIGDDRRGMELLEFHKKNNPVSKDRIFLIMINESSPFLLADFSLKGGDIVMSKPFSNEVFVNTVKDAISTREQLSVDECLALSIQDAINSNELEKAATLQESFKDQESLNALYSKAILYESNQELDAAYETFEKVIKLKADFKSLVRMVKIGTTLQKHFEMIELIELWLKNFPLHHDSILDISRVIIANKKYELLDELFDVFSKHKVSEDFAKIPLAAGFVMASAHHLKAGHKGKTRDYALRAIDYSCKKAPIIVKSLDMLVKSGAGEEAENAYQRLDFPMESPDDKVVDIKMRSVIYPKAKVLVDCLKLLSQKVIDPDLYKITISCLKHIGKDPQDMIVQARRAFPGIAFDQDES